MACNRVLILSLPRSGSSVLTRLIASAGYSPTTDPDVPLLGASELNEGGYFEEIPFILLNDQIIRLHYGGQYNFLNIPDYEGSQSILSGQSKLSEEPFSYDILEEGLEIPSDFESNVSKYTGQDWDVWGITRMKSQGKWNRCYSNYGIADELGIEGNKALYEQKVNESSRPLVLKDPRLAFTLPFYDFNSDVKVVTITRKPDEVFASMRRHYGPRLFSEDCFEEYDWVSNHFNFKVPPGDFEHYLQEYQKFIEYSARNFSCLSLDYNELLEGKGFESLEDFIEAPVSRDLLKRKV